MARSMQFISLLIVLSWALGGCVSMGTFELKEKEASDAARSLQELQRKYSDLSSEYKNSTEKLASEIAGLSQEKETLTAENKKLTELLKAKSDELSSELAEIRQKSSDLEKENNRLREETANLQKAKAEEAQKTSRTYEEMLEKMKNEISQGQVTISELKGKLTVNMVDAILFDSGKTEVKPSGLVVLQKVIDILKTVKDKTIHIEGHTDNVQISNSLARTYPTNWELSSARAINVTRYMQQQGIDPLMLSAVAYGEYHPVAANNSDEGKAKNRRIEIIVAPKDSP